MINANELRPGNWVLINKSPVIITSIDTRNYDGEEYPKLNGIVLFDRGGCESEPIPIDEGVLVKCGWEHKTDCDYPGWFSPTTLLGERMRIFKQADYFCYHRGIASVTKITSIHQLQNLFFAIYLEELGGITL